MTPAQLDLFREWEGLARAAADRIVRSIPDAAPHFEDLLQEGRAAIIKCTESYDAQLSIPFPSYAYRAAFLNARRLAIVTLRCASGGRDAQRAQEFGREDIYEQHDLLHDAPDPERALAAKEVASLVVRRVNAAAAASSSKSAAQDAADFIAWQVGDGSIWDLAKERGFSRQRLHFRFKPIRAEFEQLVAELRAEAA